MPGEGPSGFSLSVKALVTDPQGRCLVLRRSQASKNNAGKWEFPGGKLDPGERFDEALTREILEETGLTVTLVGPFDTAMSNAAGLRIVYLFMLAGAESMQVRLSGEHDAFKWVVPSDLPGIDLAGQFRPVAQRYAEYARGRAAPNHP